MAVDDSYSFPEPPAHGGAAQSVTTATIVALFALILSGVWAYWPTLQEVVHTWNTNPDYTHGFLVVPISVWFLWRRRIEFPRDPVRWSAAGVALIIVAGVMRYVAGRLYLPQLDAWSIPVWIAGLIWALFGPGIFRWSAPAIAFLWFAAPIPGTIGVLLSAPLQKLAANLTAAVLQMLGHPALAEGTVVLFGEHVLDVERACSGLRMFFGIAALAVGYILITRPTRAKAVLLVFAAAPAAIAANIFRVTVTALLLQYVSGEAAKVFAHDVSGWVMIPVAVGLFATLMGVMNHFSRTLNRDRRAGTVALIRYGVILSLGVGGLMLWHRYQRDRAFDALLDVAATYEAEGKWGDAAAYLNRYVLARPNDGAVVERLATAFEKSTRTRNGRSRAAQLYFTAWQRLPDEVGLGRRSVELAIETQQYALALRVCDLLLQNAERSSDESLRDFALAHRADAKVNFVAAAGARLEYDWVDCLADLLAAREVADGRVSRLILLADIYRERLTDLDDSERIEKADAAIDLLLDEYPDEPHARLARYIYGKKYWTSTDGSDRRRDPDSDLDYAIELGQRDSSLRRVAVLLAAASRSSARSNVPAARRYLDDALAVAPNDPRVYLLRSEVERTAAGDAAAGLDAAIGSLQQGVIATSGRDFRILISLASLLVEAGRMDEARDLADQMESAFVDRLEGTQLKTVQLGIAYIRGKSAVQAGEFAMAARLLESELATLVELTSPISQQVLGSCWMLLGEAYEELGYDDRAIDAYRRCGRADGKSVAWRWSLAGVLMRSGNARDALDTLQRLADDHPDQADVWLQLATVQIQQEILRDPLSRRWGAAERSIATAAALEGVDPARLAIVRTELSLARNGATAAERILEAAIATDADVASLWRALCSFVNATSNTKPLSRPLGNTPNSRTVPPMLRC